MPGSMRTLELTDNVYDMDNILWFSLKCKFLLTRKGNMNKSTNKKLKRVPSSKCRQLTSPEIKPRVSRNSKFSNFCRRFKENKVYFGPVPSPLLTFHPLQTSRRAFAENTVIRCHNPEKLSLDG